MLDGKGTELQVGDIVSVPCRVVHVDAMKEEWNNITLETLTPNFPGQYFTPLPLNAKQVEFVSRDEVPLVEEEPAPTEAAKAPWELDEELDS
jgi:hypothetical protein